MLNAKSPLLMAASVVLGVALLLAVLPTGQGAHLTYGNFGSQVAWADSDYAGRFTVLASADAHMARTGGVDAQTDTYYLHIGASSDTKTTSNDIILTGSSKGTFATSGTTIIVDSDNFVANVRYLEADGKPGYTVGDFVYYSRNTALDLVTGSGSTTFSDIRLVTASALTPSAVSITAGDIVVSTSQADITEGGDADGVLPDSTTFTTSPSATFVLKWADKTGDGARGPGDPHLISAGGSDEQTFFVPGDIFLAGGEGSLGTRVTSSTAKEVPLLTNLGTDAYLAQTDHDTTSVAARHLFIHFADPDGTQDNILYGDIQIREGTTGYGTRVTSISGGQGETITCYVPIRNVLFYMDIDGVSGFSDGDAVYINRPSTTGSGGTCTGSNSFGGSSDTLALSVNDVRASTVPSTSYTVGSNVLTGETDVATYGSATANPVTGQWFMTYYNDDRANAIPLTLLTNGKIRDSVTVDSKWTAGEAVYIDADSSSTITANDVRLYHSSLTSSTMATKKLVASDDSDASGAPALITIASPNPQIYITGSDATYDNGKSEYVYLSADTWVNAPDICVYGDGTCTAAGSVGNTGNDVTFKGMGGGTERYFYSWCQTVTGIVTCSTSTPPLLLHAHDVEVTSAGTRVSPTGSDHVPWLQLLTEGTSTQRLVRWNHGDGSSLIDDTFYMAVTPGASPTQLNGDDLRITGLDSTRPAGKSLRDSTETGTPAGDLTFSSVVFRTLVEFIDPDANGYDVGDFLVVDLPSALGGGNVGTYGTADIRLTPAGATSGSSSNAAGTIRKAADADSIFTTLATVSGSNDFHVYGFDQNRDGAYDSEDRGHDRFYILYNDGATESQSAVITPQINSVRFSGPGGSTMPTGANTATAAAETTTSTSTTSTTSTSTSTSSSTTSSSTSESSVSSSNTSVASSAQPGGPTPGLGAWVAAGAIGVAAAVVTLARRRR